ncbi:MAG: hypothetical protein ACYCVB_16170 [Bacilli bacterium]
MHDPSRQAETAYFRDCDLPVLTQLLIQTGGMDMSALELGHISSGIVVLVMYVLGIMLTIHYIRKRHVHTLWWAVSFWLAFLAAVTDFISYQIGGWMLWQYRVYLFAAASLVAYMGAGTIYLFSSRAGRIYVLVMSAIAAVLLVTLVSTAYPGVAKFPAGEQAADFIPAGVAAYFGILSGVGALALFGGASYSWIKTRQSYNLWIALGALIFSIGGAVGSAVGIYQLFYVFQAVGSLVLYRGIVLTFPHKIRIGHGAVPQAEVAAGGSAQNKG